MHDVVVVGGGPTGCYVASLLGQRGYDVHVLEEHSVIGDPVDCSGVIGSESFTALGFPASLKLGEVNSLTLVSPSKLEVRFLPPSSLACVVDRASFDRAIARKAEASGATFHLGSRVVELRQEKGYVEVRLESESWEPISSARSTMKAALVILAGGPRYKFQRELGMGQPANFLKTAQTEVEVQGIKEAKVFLGSELAPGSFAWIVPFRREGIEFARIGVSAKVRPLSYLKKLLRQLYAQGHLYSHDVPIRSWVIPISPLRKTYADHVLAVGDAAGQTKPTTGGGIYYGLLCAQAAAKTVAGAFEKRDFGANTLSRYETEWRRRLGREISMGFFFRRLAGKLTDGEIDDLFRIVHSDGVLAAVSRKARFDWHKDVVYFALRHPALGRIFLRGLFR